MISKIFHIVPFHQIYKRWVYNTHKVPSGLPAKSLSWKNVNKKEKKTDKEKDEERGKGGEEGEGEGAREGESGF